MTREGALSLSHSCVRAHTLYLLAEADARRRHTELTLSLSRGARYSLSLSFCMQAGFRRRGDFHAPLCPSHIYTWMCVCVSRRYLLPRRASERWWRHWCAADALSFSRAIVQSLGLAHNSRALFGEELWGAGPFLHMCSVFSVRSQCSDLPTRSSKILYFYYL